MKRSLVSLVVAAGFAVGIAVAFATGLTGCGTSAQVCQDDHCVCSPSEPCSHDCSVGGNSCEVQCAPGEPCSVGCAAGELCHVECSAAASCTVDCGTSPQCHVTCPATGCTVEQCVGAACEVTCGNAALPRRSGTTATCP